MAEFIHIERTAVEPRTRLTEKYASRRGKSNPESQKNPYGSKRHDNNRGKQYVEQTFDNLSHRFIQSGKRVGRMQSQKRESVRIPTY